MHILLKDGIVYELHEYDNEEELQEFVYKHWEKIFGTGTLIFPGERIGAARGQKGAKGIPDFFVLDLNRKKWFIIEVELSSHDPDDHIIPQITSFMRAWKKPDSLHDLQKKITTFIKGNGQYHDIFKKAAGESEIYECVSDIMEHPPTLVVIADKISEDLVEACDIIHFDKEYIDFETYRREGIGDLVPIFKFRKIKTSDVSKERKKSITTDGEIKKQRASINKGIRTLTFLDKSAQIKNVKEINAIIANELIKKGYLTSDKVPWGTGRKRYYVSKTPTHPTGNKFFAPVQLDNGWWIETHASEKRTLYLAQKLMNACGVEKSSIKLT